MYRNGIAGESGLSVYWLYLKTRSGTIVPTQTESASQYVIPAVREDMSLNHSLDTTSIAACFTPSWNTVVYPIRIDLTKLLVKFSVSAPDRGATVDFAFSLGSSDTVSADAESHVI